MDFLNLLILTYRSLVQMKNLFKLNEYLNFIENNKPCLCATICECLYSSERPNNLSRFSSLIKSIINKRPFGFKRCASARVICIGSSK